MRKSKKVLSSSRRATRKVRAGGVSAVRHQSTDPHVRLSERPRLPDLDTGRFGRLFSELDSQKSSTMQPPSLPVPDGVPNWPTRKKDLEWQIFSNLRASHDL